MKAAQTATRLSGTGSPDYGIGVNCRWCTWGTWKDSNCENKASWKAGLPSASTPASPFALVILVLWELWPYQLFPRMNTSNLLPIPCPPSKVSLCGPCDPVKANRPPWASMGRASPSGSPPLSASFPSHSPLEKPLLWGALLPTPTCDVRPSPSGPALPSSALSLGSHGAQRVVGPGQPQGCAWNLRL